MNGLPEGSTPDVIYSGSELHYVFLKCITNENVVCAAPPRKRHKVLPVRAWISAGRPFTAIKKKKKKKKQKLLRPPVVFPTASGPAHLPQPPGGAPGGASAFAQWPNGEITPLRNTVVKGVFPHPPPLWNN